MVVDHPYANLPPTAFWKSGVREARELTAGLYRPKVKIDASTRIMTAGSCFAQHISRALRRANLNLIETEYIRLPQLSEALLNRFGYGLYSARYGNIYTMRQLKQLIEEVGGDFYPKDIIWRASGRCYDALRPNVEPSGYTLPAHVTEMRAHHLRAVRKALAEVDILIFTLGLTEAWEHIPSGTVYPTAPGTIAGTYDPTIHRLRQFSAGEIAEDFLSVRNRIQSRRPDARFILTVSPVPLTATGTGEHVLLATHAAKAKLRTTAAELCETFDDVDYFPSYEIVTHPRLGPAAFEANMRSPTAEVIARVVRCFLGAHGLPLGQAAPPVLDDSDPADGICEEALLEAFVR
ncbi:MAG: GSCFA domain-containing protein [Pseudomonadota bacterium]